jgi:FkbM family methyltransferase
MNTIEYKSQFGQDKFIIEKVFQYMKDGYFIEIGAGDGDHISNTKVLETEFRWRGLCIECNQFAFEKLRQNRKCKVSNVPITHDGRIVQFNSIELWGYYNNLFSSINAVPKEFEDHVIKTELQSETLVSCLRRLCVPHFIHYLSLDIEGFEYEILKQFFDNKNTVSGWTWEICSLSVEHNFDVVKRENIKKLMEENLYTRVLECNVDDIYVHNLFIHHF